MTFIEQQALIDRVQVLYGDSDARLAERLGLSGDNAAGQLRKYKRGKAELTGPLLAHLQTLLNAFPPGIVPARLAAESGRLRARLGDGQLEKIVRDALHGRTADEPDVESCLEDITRFAVHAHNGTVWGLYFNAERSRSELVRLFELQAERS